MRTWTGLDAPLGVNEGSVSLLDLVVHLGRTPRFGGWGDREYSVLSHSFLVTLLWLRAGFPLDEVHHALLHDAHEAYTGDIPAPVKRAWRALGAGDAIRTLERRLDARIYEELGAYGEHDLRLPAEATARRLKICDLAALVIEASLFAPPQTARTIDDRDIPAELRDDVQRLVQSACPELQSVALRRGAVAARPFRAPASEPSGSPPPPGEEVGTRVPFVVACERPAEDALAAGAGAGEAHPAAADETDHAPADDGVAARVSLEPFVGIDTTPPSADGHEEHAHDAWIGCKDASPSPRPAPRAEQLEREAGDEVAPDATSAASPGEPVAGDDQRKSEGPDGGEPAAGSTTAESSAGSADPRGRATGPAAAAKEESPAADEEEEIVAAAEASWSEPPDQSPAPGQPIAEAEEIDPAAWFWAKPLGGWHLWHPDLSESHCTEEEAEGQLVPVDAPPVEEADAVCMTCQVAPVPAVERWEKVKRETGAPEASDDDWRDPDVRAADEERLSPQPCKVEGCKNPGAGSRNEGYCRPHARELLHAGRREEAPTAAGGPDVESSAAAPQPMGWVPLAPEGYRWLVLDSRGAHLARAIDDKNRTVCGEVLRPAGASPSIAWLPEGDVPRGVAACNHCTDAAQHPESRAQMESEEPWAQKVERLEQLRQKAAEEEAAKKQKRARKPANVPAGCLAPREGGGTCGAPATARKQWHCGPCAEASNKMVRGQRLDAWKAEQKAKVA